MIEGIEIQNPRWLPVKAGQSQSLSLPIFIRSVLIGLRLVIQILVMGNMLCGFWSSVICYVDSGHG